MNEPKLFFYPFRLYDLFIGVLQSLKTFPARSIFTMDPQQTLRALKFDESLPIYYELKYVQRVSKIVLCPSSTTYFRRYCNWKKISQYIGSYNEPCQLAIEWTSIFKKSLWWPTFPCHLYIIIVCLDVSVTSWQRKAEAETSHSWWYPSVRMLSIVKKVLSCLHALPKFSLSPLLQKDTFCNNSISLASAWEQAPWCEKFTTRRLNGHCLCAWCIEIIFYQGNFEHYDPLIFVVTFIGHIPFHWNTCHYTVKWTIWNRLLIVILSKTVMEGRADVNVTRGGFKAWNNVQLRQRKMSPAVKPIDSLPIIKPHWLVVINAYPILLHGAPAI